MNKINKIISMDTMYSSLLNSEERMRSLCIADEDRVSIRGKHWVYKIKKVKNRIQQPPRE